MLPHLHLISTAFDDLIGEGAFDDLHMGYDLGTIDVLRRSERARHDKARAEWNDGLITIDEYRGDTGRDPLEVPASRSLWIPGGRAGIARDEADQEAIYPIQSGMPPMQAGTPAPPGGNGGVVGADPTDPGGGGQPVGDPGAGFSVDRGAGPGDAEELRFELPYELANELKGLGMGDATGQLWPQDLTDEELDAVITGTKTLEDVARERLEHV